MCMIMCMRTNIVLDEKLVKRAMKYSSKPTRRAAVHEALEVYVASKVKVHKTAQYRSKLAEILRRVEAEPVRTSAHELIRSDRDRGCHDRHR